MHVSNILRRLPILAALATLALATPHAYAQQTLYVSEGNIIDQFNSSGVGSVFATSSSGLNDSQGLAFDSAGNLFVADSGTSTS